MRRRLTVVCPAGTGYLHSSEGPACHCGVEDSEVTAAQDPTSLIAYCTGTYTNCPTWRRAKEHRWMSRTLVEQLQHEVAAKREDMRGTILDDPQAPAFTVPAIR